jgi:two-component system, OmpR family, sensor kinase
VFALSRRLSASGRVTFAMTSVLAAAIVALCLMAYATTLQSLIAETDKTLLHEASEYALAMAGSAESTSLVDATYGYLGARTGAGAGPDPILLVSIAGHKPLVNSGVRLEDAVGNSAASEPTSAVRGFSTMSIDGVTYRVITTTISDGKGHQEGVFQAALSDESPRVIAASVATALAAAGLIVMLAGLFLSLWAARASLRPLQRMAGDAAAVSHSAPGHRIAYDGPDNDELGSLARSLNAMLDRLERSFADQRQFVADASHELRTPVAIIRGNIEMLQGDGINGSDAQDTVRMIDAESARMTRLLDDLLSLARLDGVKREFQALDVATILHEGAARARKLASRQITTDCQPGLWVKGDPDLLDQALVNMIRNAIAHTAEGGRLALSCAQHGDTVELSVTDDGPGIPQAELNRIFDRFYRARTPRQSDTGGAGLGLAIAKRLVDLHDGTMGAENVEPHGARFTISLPRIDAPADALDGVGDDT